MRNFSVNLKPPSDIKMTSIANANFYMTVFYM